ncbi:ImuA family protein [Palleronia caenipelagi]|uniref:Protein ImuA n=1 Tax=Palleronia caenipelagi TaxID=2489174 RepID=A0A547Q8S3_9RHOB|nr:hypothetical protein [Palleronia caenipelagi]TRD22772.1 hypothetical protein FEV53_03035 [Palleronia caenipelagi]
MLTHSNTAPPLRGASSIELFPKGPGDGGWMGFVLGALSGVRAGRVLWVQDRLSALEGGRPGFVTGTLRVIHVTLSHPRDALIAAEEGLRCRSLAAVLAEIHGDPPVLDFTATKRLAFRAERSGTPCWLIRHGAPRRSSAMRERWQVESLPSLPHPDDPKAPGLPRWQAELFRSRSQRPGIWEVSRDPKGGLRFSAPLRDREMADPVAAPGRSALG